MAQIVKCDVCGKIYSESYLGSHKRLSHGKREESPRWPKNEEARIETILSIYDHLTEQGKKEVLACLTGGKQTNS